jgi:hypothetical protein
MRRNDLCSESRKGSPRVLLVVPPFGTVQMPSLSVHSLQSFSRQFNHSVSILYANILFAARIGPRRYQAILSAERKLQIGGRIFAPHSFACGNADLTSRNYRKRASFVSELSQELHSDWAECERQIPNLLRDIVTT